MLVLKPPKINTKDREIVSKPRFVFLNDDIVPWDEAKIHVATGAVKFGAAVFEGIRGYWNEQQEQLYLFQLEQHMQRLGYSQTFMRFDEVIDTGYIGQKTIELVKANEFREPIHVMTTIFVNGFGGPTTSGPVGLSITAGPRGDLKFVDTGCSAQVSSWQRVADNAMPMRVKCNANYQNGRLAAMQALADGYDTAILLNARGKVSEGPSMCFFMVRDGVAVTPTVNSDILESITRKTILGLLPELCDVKAVERDIDRSELLAAEEAFFCGTAWEVTPITSIDKLPVGSGQIGPVVKRLQDTFFRIARGDTPDYAHWRTPV